MHSESRVELLSATFTVRIKLIELFTAIATTATISVATTTTTTITNVIDLVKFAYCALSSSLR